MKVCTNRFQANALKLSVRNKVIIRAIDAIGRRENLNVNCASDRRALSAR